MAEGSRMTVREQRLGEKSGQVLFTATKRNCHKYQVWLSPSEALAKRIAYELDGWNVHVSQSLGRIS